MRVAPHGMLSPRNQSASPQLPHETGHRSFPNAVGLVQAGVMLAGEGLHPRSKGVRVRFAGNKRIVIDGPFGAPKELIAGYWLWQVKSKEEAIEWVKRCPNPHDEDCEIEIRQIFEAEDFGAALTPELRAQEERLRAQAGERAKTAKR
jgi:hypothetical protein